MDLNTKSLLTVEPYPSNDPDIGRWLWAMQDTRSRTMERLQGVGQAQLDWQPSETESSIGSVLYHIALIEADWLYAEVLEQPYPAEVVALLPHGDRDEDGRLTHVAGPSMDEHVKRLETVRGLLLDVYQRMDKTDYRRLRSLPDYDVSPEWVLHHLVQHETEHLGQIGSLITRMQVEEAVAICG